MVIDFHTHIFPDKIAAKTIDYLSKKGGIPPFSDGSVSGLISCMERASVDISVTLPVLTNPESFDSINRYAAGINETYGGSLISFGGIHPGCDDIDTKMRFLKEKGFRGVKIHPDYQDAYINDDGYVRIVNCAREYDLIVVTHAGLDVAYPNNVHCTPHLVKDLLKKAPHNKLVLAHMGGGGFYPEVLELLCDEDVYFDTAYVLRYIGEDTFNAIVRNRGDDRILFASDSPWSCAGNDIEILKNYVKSEISLEKILYSNAKKLLEI